MLYEAYSQPIPSVDGRKVFRITYPEHADQFGDFFEVIETGNHTSPYKPRDLKSYNIFYLTVLDWFSDYKLLSD
jgi:hypothetical protein